MKNVIISAISAIFLISCAAIPQPADAQEKPNILVMGEDADKDTVPRHSRVFKRVLDAIAGELHNEGFDIFDEVALTLDNFAQDRTRRTDAEVIDIARSVQRPPIDVVILFSIYASADELTYTTKIKARITGRLLQVKSGQRLGNFEVEAPETWIAPVDCPRECVLETVGKYSRTLAKDLGAVLAIKLADLLESGDAATATASGGVGIADAYTLVFSGFTPEEVLDLEEYLVVFTGYKNHRPIYSGTRHFEFWYETTSDSSRLRRNLTKMLGHVALGGRVVFAGNEFSVTKIARRKSLKINKADFQ